MKYTCPVCFYPELEDPPADFEICPACGTHFGYSDSAPTPKEKIEKHSILRRKWLESGAIWFDYSTPKPLDWA